MEEKAASLAGLCFRLLPFCVADESRKSRPDTPTPGQSLAGRGRCQRVGAADRQMIGLALETEEMVLLVTVCLMLSAMLIAARPLLL